MSAVVPRIRPATVADIPAIVWISAADDEWIADEDREGSRYVDHLLDVGRLLVAEVEGVAVGFAGSVALDAPTRSFTFITDLFVDPAVQSRGVGRRLMDEVLAGSATGEVATFSSSDPRAMPLYVRAGMAAWWPLVYVAGHPGRLPTTGLATEPLSIEAATMLERDLTGADRSAAWTWWGRRPGAGPFAVLSDGRPVAVGAVGYEAGDPARWSPRVPSGRGQPPAGGARPGEAPAGAARRGEARPAVRGPAVPDRCDSSGSSSASTRTPSRRPWRPRPMARRPTRS